MVHRPADARQQELQNPSLTATFLRPSPFPDSFMSRLMCRAD